MNPKYNRKIFSVTQPGAWVEVDVYAVLKAFGVTCPATQHAIKKMLAAGKRGKATLHEDIQDAIDSLQRAAQMEGEEDAAR